jgi:outer membrane translocation and assembly module TamA
VFVDVARASRGLTTTDERIHTDVGAGLRIALPGAGLIRIDLARGLRDGRTALSVAIVR